MIRGKRPASKRSAAGKRLEGAMREVQTLEFARRLREVRESLKLSQAVGRPAVSTLALPSRSCVSALG